MKIFAFSDGHGNLPAPESIPADVDLIVIAGDVAPDFYGDNATKQFNWWQDRFFDWCEEINFPDMIVVFGNHDCGAEKYCGPLTDFLEDICGVYVLTNKIHIYNGVKFYGSPYTKTPGRWAFNVLSDAELGQYWRNIPDDTNVLITHSPPRYAGDRLESGEHVGSESLARRMIELKHLKLSITGHIHISYGVYHIGGAPVYNVSHCDESYKPVNPPIIIEV